MRFNYQGNTFDVKVENGHHVKVYTVPKDYSADGLFVARWMPSIEIEVIPACFQLDAHIIADLNIMNENPGEDSDKITLSATGTCADGLTYSFPENTPDTSRVATPQPARKAKK